MLKPLTLSLSLAVALGLCSMSKAGLHDNNCTTCGLASPQGVVASPQGSYGGCGAHRLRSEAPLRQRPEEPLPPPGHLRVGAEEEAQLVQPRRRLQHLRRWRPGVRDRSGRRRPVGPVSRPRRASTAAPQVYGAGQRAFIPARSTTSIASVPAEMTPAAVGGEEVPPAPEVKGTATAPRAACCCPPPRATEVGPRRAVPC